MVNPRDMAGNAEVEEEPQRNIAGNTEEEENEPQRYSWEHRRRKTWLSSGCPAGRQVLSQYID